MMKNGMMMAFAALAAFEAAAITATKEYVDRRDTEIRTNTYTKAETDASKRSKTDLAVYEGYAPWTIWQDGHQMTWNVSGWEIHDDEFGADRILSWENGVWTLVGNLDSGEKEAVTLGDENALRLVFGSEVLWRTAIYVTNGAHIVTSEELAPGMTTNDVCAIVTNEIHTVGEWEAAWDPEYYGEVLRFGGPHYEGNDQWNISYRPVRGMAFDRWAFTNGSEYATELVFSGSFGQTNFMLTLTRTHVSENALGLARLPDVTNMVTKAYVEGLGIEAGISAATATNIAESVAEAATEGMITVEQDPNWTAEKDEYAKTGTVAQVSAAVGTLWSYVYGDSVWIAVTNYMRTIGGVSPSFQLWEVRDGATNLVYWSKEEITNVTHDLIYDCKTNLEQTVRNAVAEMPDKAWSKYQSATGNEAPDGVTIVSTPTIQLTGGGEWYRYVDVASNSVWFLKSNGLHTFGGDTNGYFRILDDEGNATFEVRKTDSYLVDAVASSVHFDGDGNFCVSFESNIEPVIYTTPSLESPNFLPQGDDPNVTVTWTQSGGTYTATLEQAVKGPSLFAYAKVEVHGTTVIRNTAPTDVSGGILCTDGIHKCRPVYTNGAITWEVMP